MEIGNRIRKLRKELGINQTDFASKIGLKQSAIGLYENNDRRVSDQTIKLICTEFGVNEHWLRTGEGEMFTEQNASLVRQLAEKYNLSETGENIIRLFCQLDQHSRDVIEKFISDVAAASNPAERVLYIARSGDQGETRITKDAQEEALRALDESSDPDL